MQDKIEIGIARLEYNENGSIKFAKFIPSEKVINSPSLFSIGSDNDSEIIKENSDLVISSWMNEINEIELADQEEYKMQSLILNCEKYESGLVKICEIKYFFQKRNLN